ncbi:MAG: VWA domain-containing protein [Chloroflexi bacterium]|nr:VWA domain-containing protein [Chloroflexota bacterium]
MSTSAPDFFLKNLLLFGRLLRLMGLDVGVSDMLELAEALTRIDLARKPDVYHTARAVLVRRHEDYPLFDQAWQAFWRKPSNQRLQRLELQPDPRLVPKPLRVPNAPRGEGDGEGGRKPQDEIVAHQQSFSANELLRRKDFGVFTWEEVQEAKRLMAQMRWRIGERHLRRRKPVADGRYIDLRRTARANLRYGGELLTLAWKRRKTKPRPLVILCDISGSMEQYARMLLHFVHTISSGFDFDRVEAFVFSTRLTRITRQLAHRDVDDAMDAVEAAVQDWGGGTRIGEALHGFNFQWARRVLGRGAVVMVISDGWDRGEPQALAREMERLQKSCHRLIWLNPLIGSEGYQPLTQGLVAALPYVDDFLSVRNLDSLEALGQALSALSDRRPARRQQPFRAPPPPAPAPDDEHTVAVRRAQEREAVARRLKGLVGT